MPPPAAAAAAAVEQARLSHRDRDDTQARRSG